MALLGVGQQVLTEWGVGIVRESSARRVYIVLNSGGSLNIATGTPGYDRISCVDIAKDVQAENAGKN